MTPGGPLHDPERDGVDPDHTQSVELVGPVPRELAEPARSGPPPRGHDRHTRHRPAGLRRMLWALVALIAAAVVVGILGLRAGSCPDSGDCSVVVGGGPVGWVVAVAFAALTVHAVRRVVLGDRHDGAEMGRQE